MRRVVLFRDFYTFNVHDLWPTFRMELQRSQKESDDVVCHQTIDMDASGYPRSRAEIPSHAKPSKNELENFNKAPCSIKRT